MQADELSSKYARVDDENAQAGWTELYNAAATGCMHGPSCALGSGCQVGCPSMQASHNPSLLVMHNTAGQHVLDGGLLSSRNQLLSGSVLLLHTAC